MRIGFTGTRHGMTVQQRAKVAKIVLSGRTATSNLEAHHGDCLGADSEFHDIAVTFRVGRIIAHPPNQGAWRAHRQADEVREPKTYAKRNVDIVAECDLLVAAPLESKEQSTGGTWMTVRIARSQHKPLIIVWPDGTTTQERT